MVRNMWYHPTSTRPIFVLSVMSPAYLGIHVCLYACACMYVCMRVRVRACMLLAYEHMEYIGVYIKIQNTCARTCENSCIHVCRTWIQDAVLLARFVYSHIHAHVYTYRSACACMRKLAYMYVSIRTDIRTEDAITGRNIRH